MTCTDCPTGVRHGVPVRDRLVGMTISLEGLRTVIYPSPDLDAAKSWWTTLLGAGPYFDEPGMIT